MTIRAGGWRGPGVMALGLALSAACSGAPGGDPRSDMGGGDGLGDMRAVGGICDAPPADVARARARARSCPVGADAALFLRAAPYQKISIEIDATTGAAPRQAAIDHLVRLFGDVTAKPGGVTVHVDDTVAAPGHPLTLAEIRAIEDAARDEFADGDTAVFYFLVVGDRSADDTSEGKVLGLAHRASSMVIFQGTIDSIAGGLGQPSREVVEQTVAAHELGHLLGLVNLGTPMQTPHEDGAHRGHDGNNGCLMYYANNSSQLLGNLIGGGRIPDFDAACRADLAAVREGR